MSGDVIGIGTNASLTVSNSSMDWHRGLSTGLIFLFLSAPLIVCDVARVWDSRFIPWIEHQKLTQNRTQDGIGWDTQEGHTWLSNEERVLTCANLPAVLVSGYLGRPFGLALLTKRAFGSFSRARLLAEAIALELLIFFQWAIVGAAPILRSRGMSLPRYAGYFTLAAGLLLAAYKFLWRPLVAGSSVLSQFIDFLGSVSLVIMTIFGLSLLLFWVVWLLTALWKLIRCVARLPLKT